MTTPPMSESDLHAWPAMDIIIRSLNARSNFAGRVMDDPLFGIVITPEMWARAHAHERARALQSREGEGK